MEQIDITPCRNNRGEEDEGYGSYVTRASGSTRTLLFCPFACRASAVQSPCRNRPVLRRWGWTGALFLNNIVAQGASVLYVHWVQTLHSVAVRVKIRCPVGIC